MEQAIDARKGRYPRRANTNLNTKSSAHNHRRCVQSIETLLHYVRMASGLPSRIPAAPPTKTFEDVDPVSAVAWHCRECGTMVPRTQSPPDTCPCCGAARQEFSSEVAA